MSNLVLLRGLKTLFDRQVGSSGQTVTPKVCIALGISDYGIVGDLFVTVPTMVEEIKKTKK